MTHISMAHSDVLTVRCWRKKTPYILLVLSVQMAVSFNACFTLIGFLRALCKRLDNPCPMASGNHSRLSLQNLLALSCLPFESCHFSLRLDTLDFLSFLTDIDLSSVFVANDRNPIETNLNNYVIEKSGHNRIQGLQQYYHISVSISCLCCPFCWLHSDRLIPSGGKSATGKGCSYCMIDCINVPNSLPLLHACPLSVTSIFPIMGKLYLPPPLMLGMTM